MATGTEVPQKRYPATPYQKNENGSAEISEKLSEILCRSESLTQVLHALPRAKQPSAEGVALLSEVLCFLGKCDIEFGKR